MEEDSVAVPPLLAIVKKEGQLNLNSRLNSVNTS